MSMELYVFTEAPCILELTQAGLITAKNHCFK